MAEPAAAVVVVDTYRTVVVAGRFHSRVYRS